MWYWDALQFGFDGLLSTMSYSLAALLLSLVAGMILGLLAFSLPALRGPIRIYTQLWRGLPVLVTFFVVFFVFPLAGVSIPGPVAVVFGLSLWGSAYLAEIVIGALQALPASQALAAKALGMGPWRALVHVLLPQAMPRMLPAVVNVLTALIHGTALSASVGAVDMLEAVKRTSAHLTFFEGDPHSFVLYGSLMVVYFGLCYPLSLLAKHLDKRQKG